jgi:hypothetical protein
VKFCFALVPVLQRVMIIYIYMNICVCVRVSVCVCSNDLPTKIRSESILTVFERLSETHLTLFAWLLKNIESIFFLVAEAN